MEHVTDIATEPNLVLELQKGKIGSITTRKGKPAKGIIKGTREGVLIRVVIEPYEGGRGIISAFPEK